MCTSKIRRHQNLSYNSGEVGPTWYSLPQLLHSSSALIVLIIYPTLALNRFHPAALELSRVNLPTGDLPQPTLTETSRGLSRSMQMYLVRNQDCKRCHFQ